MQPDQTTHLMPSDVPRRRAIGVFAHNESRKILACLEALRLSPMLPNTTCYVIANGCNDDTVAHVTEYALKETWVNVVALEVGDKANAWNHFVHDIAPEAESYFFTDGDCQVETGSLQRLEESLLSDKNVNAASGIPSHHNISFGVFRHDITRHGGFAGNLYALSQDFVGRLRAQRIRLPQGLIGDDSLVGALALWNLDPSSRWNYDHVRVVPTATFRYESIIWASFFDPMFYIRRLRRYSLRHFQNQLIKARIKPLGLSILPDHIEALYLDAKSEELIPRSSLRHYIFDRWAVRAIGNARDAQKAKRAF
ncbi:MAG: glycosyltransferase [Pseudomonadota bacterium]|nr:glycosyltransferase [Pseudomonadota bacterium]